MPFIYAILGSGVQGLAAGYDLALHGDAAEVRLGDLSLETASAAAKRLEALTDKNIFRTVHADVKSPESLAAFLDGVEVCLSCVPYHLHPLAAEAVLKAGCSLIDMGGDTEDALKTLARHDEARAKGVTNVTDAGLAPGLINLLAVHLISQFERPEEAKLYCGGLPLDPKPPLQYKLAFNVEGLVSEYADKAFGVQDGKAVEMDSLDEIETIEWTGLGAMEACTTSGGTGTAPFLFGEWNGGRALARLYGQAGFSPPLMMTYEYRTIRFPGHWEKMKLFRDLGFWGTEQIEVDGAKLRPRALFEKLVGDALFDPEYRDQVLLRVEVSGMGAKGQRDKGTEGQGNGERAATVRSTLRIDLRERFDASTGLTAMQRLTGFPTAICASEIAHGRVPRGCLPFELSMPGVRMIEELGRRGIRVSTSEH